MISLITGFLVKIDNLKTSLIAVNGSFNADIRAKRPGIYGLFSKPLTKTVTTILKSANRHIVLSEDNSALKIELLDGEVALFDGMNTVKLSRENGIEIKAAPSSKVVIGGEGAAALITKKFMEFFNTHTHGAPGGATTPPTITVPADTVSTLFTEAL